MTYDLTLVVIDTEGFRVTHPIRCGGAEATTAARRLVREIRGARVEVWLGEDRLYSFGASLPAALAA